MDKVTVGFGLVVEHTPRALMKAPPTEETLRRQFAGFVVMEGIVVYVLLG